METSKNHSKLVKESDLQQLLLRYRDEVINQAKFDPFCLIDTSNSSINNFSKFKQIIEERANLYQTLRRNISKIEGETIEDSENSLNLQKDSVGGLSNLLFSKGSSLPSLDPRDEKEQLKTSLIQKKDKSTMVRASDLTGASANLIDIRDRLPNFKIQVDASNKIPEIDSASTKDRCSFICFKGPDSYLSTLHGSKLTVVSQGFILYSSLPPPSMRFITEVISLGQDYLIYDERNGRILIKSQDHKDPEVWWDQEAITNFDYHGRQLRASADSDTVGVNLNANQVLVLMLRKDNTIRSSVKINVCRNEGWDRISSHEMLSNNRIISITIKGWLTSMRLIGMRRPTLSWIRSPFRSIRLERRIGSIWLLMRRLGSWLSL